MLKIISIALVAAILLAVPGIAFAQSNSGLDAYTESPPSAGGGGNGSRGDGSGSSSGPGGASDAAGNTSAAGAAGATESASGSDDLSEAQAGRRGNQRGKLPASGFGGTAGLAVTGLILLGVGIAAGRLTQRPMQNPI